MLTIHDLAFSYHDSPMFHFTLEASAGEVTVILGKSGSGKSTFFDLLCGFLSPQSGTIMIDGVSLVPLPVEKRPITILFQKHNLFEHLSVEKNISLGKQSASKEEIESILMEVGLEGFGNRQATALSGGQQQRVALARALLRQKPILLLDEPFTGLDSETREEMLALVEKITIKHQLHTIMITHEAEDTRIASQVYRMENGTLS